MIKEYKKGEYGKLSKNFRLEEGFQCKCNYPDCQITYVDTDLVDYLQKKRDEIGRSISVMSVFRCVRHNKDVGGKPGSIHMTGKAADIYFSDDNINLIADRFEDAWGLGRYPGRHFIHVDVRGYRARWTG